MNFELPSVTLIAAMAVPSRAIGCNGRLPWHLPEDMAHFRRITMGHPVVMGRRTWQSLPNGPLPGRVNIVVSRTMESSGGDASPVVCRAIDEAIAAAKQAAQRMNVNQLFIIGGESLYRQCLPMASRIFLTEVRTDPADADTFFPALPPDEWTEVEREVHKGFDFVIMHNSRCTMF